MNHQFSSFTSEDELTNSFILIVDDTPTNLELISDVLNDAGFDVAIATSGERAIKQIARRPPDLILLDIMMPGIDGFETCRRLKAQDVTRRIPIIFMSALTDTESKVSGLSIGAVDYITKPFKEQEVLARVRTHLKFSKIEKFLFKQQEQFSSLLNSLEEIVWSAQLNPFRLTYINPAVEQVLGYSVIELFNRPELWFDIVHPQDRHHFELVFEEIIDNQRIDQEYRIFRSNGELCWLHLRAQAQRCEQGGIRLDGITRDVSDRKKVEIQLIHDIHHDSLTGLANRVFFLEQVSFKLQRARQQNRYQFAILFIDLDRFKDINDSLGHVFGDRLLVQVAKILKSFFRPTDLVARLGGDEFTVLLDHIQSNEDVSMIADRVQQRIKIPCEIEGHSIFISASIGIVRGTPEYSKADELLRDADIAMYQAKGLGKACHQLFSQDMYKHALRKIELEQELRAAICQRDFFVYYQPIVDLNSQKIIGFEALIRWEHPTQGMISPLDFIPIAEETGLIIPIGEQVLTQVCQQIKKWNEQDDVGNGHWIVNVNLSVKQLKDKLFLSKIDKILAEAEIQGDQIKLELTESLFMESREEILDLFYKLKERNILLSLDDFGTGYSSLSYLRVLPIDTLKIDRSFISSMLVDSSSFEIVKAIIALAQSLQIGVIAEGIETAEQLDILKTLQCNMGQGYFFSRPLTVAQLEAQLFQRSQSILVSAELVSAEVP